jgi:hypothetical protein
MAAGLSKTKWNGNDNGNHHPTDAPISNKPVVDLNPAVHAKEPESHLKSPDMVTPTETARREDSPLNSCTPHKLGSRQTDSSQGQDSSEERQVNNKEQDRQGKHEPSR